MQESKKYQIIYADPPWRYNNRCAHSKTKFGGGVHSHYPTMSDQEIIDLGEKIKRITAPNAALFLWATMPRLPLAIAVLEAWGFRYATAAFVWVKTTKQGTPAAGPGFYTASNAEVCLLGVKGRMPPARRLINSVILEPRREHSRKPDVVRDRIEMMYPEARRLELFCRFPAPGWDVIGNQLEDGQDVREALA